MFTSWEGWDKSAVLSVLDSVMKPKHDRLYSFSEWNNYEYNVEILEYRNGNSMYISSMR
jgi:hypothetical protein